MIVIVDADCCALPNESKDVASQGDALLNLLAALEYEPQAPPLADLLKQHHQLKGDWVILSPISWQATHNDAFIEATGKDLQLSDAESKTWFKQFADYFAEDGMALHYHNSQLWLLCVDNKPSLHAKPAHQLINKPLMPELAQLDASMYWQKLITESQMLLASLPNNTAFNGVWLWGGTKLAGQKPIAVCADEHFFAMAQITSSNVTLYDPKLPLKEFQIILLHDYDRLSEQHKTELKNSSVTWYWNNCGYTLNKRNWLIRLWRHLIHAH
ncbi:MAG: hypothetical protein ACHP65_08670 [Legionellales bacterium]